MATAGRELRQAQRGQTHVVLVPLPVETLGAWHKEAVPHIRRIGQALAKQTGKNESEVVKHLFQRLGLLLQRGNAALILSRQPFFPGNTDGNP
jgi:hypothetical protein